MCEPASRFRESLPIIRGQMHLYSAQRVGGTISEPRFQPNKAFPYIKGLRLLNFAMLNTLYAITAANSTFHIAESGGASADVTIPPGTYDTYTIGATLATQLNAAGLANGYSCAVDITTMRLTIGATGGALQEFTLSWTGLPGGLGPNNYALGFGYARPAPASSAALRLTSPFPVQLLNTNKIGIRLSFGAQPCYSTANTSAAFIIENNVDYGAAIMYRPQFETENVVMYPDTQDLTSYTVSLIDMKTGLPLDTRGAEWEMILGIL